MADTNIGIYILSILIGVCPDDMCFGTEMKSTLKVL